GAVAKAAPGASERARAFALDGERKAVRRGVSEPEPEGRLEAADVDGIGAEDAARLERVQAREPDRSAVRPGAAVQRQARAPAEGHVVTPVRGTPLAVDVE